MALRCKDDSVACGVIIGGEAAVTYPPIITGLDCGWVAAQRRKKQRMALPMSP